MIGTVKINGVDRPAVDDECYDLAEHFLCGERPYSADNCWALAGAIQQAIEDWFDHRDSTSPGEGAPAPEQTGAPMSPAGPSAPGSPTPLSVTEIEQDGDEVLTHLSDGRCAVNKLPSREHHG